MGHPLPFSSVQQVADEISELLPSYRSLTDSENTGQSNFTCFFPVEYNPPVKNPEGAYPFTLLIGTTPNHFGTGTRSSRSSRLKKFSPEAFLEISVPDAQKLAITDSDKVRVISPAGELTVRVKITDTLPEGILFIPTCFPETPVNRLFNVVLDPETKTPSLKACNVMVERAETNG
jgi:predicted molibdopterin-dependent oxidoreductase YjgC